MITPLIIMAVLALGSAAYITRPLWAGRVAEPARARHDVQVFKSQLAEIDKDLARGLMSDDEAEGARREISRRLLAADGAAQASTDVAAAPAGLARRGAQLSAGLLVLGAVGVYAMIGAPHQQAEPLSARDLQSEAEAMFAANLERGGWTPPPFPQTPEGSPDFETLLKGAPKLLAARPDDAALRIKLAEIYASAQRPNEAWPLLAEAIDLLGPEADPELYAWQGEAMVLAAGGVVSPAAIEVLQRAPSLAQSRYYLALAEAQRGDVGLAMRVWASLLQSATPGGPSWTLLRERITLTARENDIDPAPYLAHSAEAQPGPSADDIEAASELSADEQSAMIEGMVAGLAARLEENPDDLEGWVRLIRSYGVLGDRQSAQEAYARAVETFAGDPTALKRLESLRP